MQKINYNQKMEEIIKKNKNQSKKPRLLMQVCCAPCSSAVMEKIQDDFVCDMYYYNPMIYPQSELDKRIDTLKRLKESMNIMADIIIADNDIKDYKDIGKMRKDDKEAGKACYECYKLRLEKTAIYAAENDYDYFSTTLSISPHKRSDWLNEIGADLSKKYKVNYLYSDFKKKNGYKRSIELSRKYDLYRQDYCGCVFSYKEMLDRENKKDN